MIVSTLGETAVFWHHVDCDRQPWLGREVRTGTVVGQSMVEASLACFEYTRFRVPLTALGAVFGFEDLQILLAEGVGIVAEPQRCEPVTNCMQPLDSSVSCRAT